MKESKRIKYQKGFKYQLIHDVQFNVDIFPAEPIETPFIELRPSGDFTIYKGYAWDGPSGPTIDTPNFMRGSLVHDALYQLMRLEKLSLDYKTQADAELKRCCLADGMSALRTWWVIRGLYRFGTSATLPKNKKDTLIAPH